jgi:hypothetical protein
MQRVPNPRSYDSQNTILSFLPFSMFLLIFSYIFGLRVSPFFSGLLILPLVTFLGFPLLTKPTEQLQKIKDSSQNEYGTGNRPFQPELSRQGKELVLFRLARKYKGWLSIPKVTLDSGLALDEVDELLQDLYSRGYCECIIEDEGSVVYKFPDFIEG